MYTELYWFRFRNLNRLFHGVLKYILCKPTIEPLTLCLSSHAEPFHNLSGLEVYDNGYRI